MLLARYDSGLYQLLLILHILAVIVAFAPSVVHSVTGARLLREDEGAGRRFFSAASASNRMVHLPALVAVGVLGFALVGVSDRTFKFSDAWVGLAILLWLAIAGVVSGLILPGERSLAAGEAGAESKVRLGGGIVSVLLLVVIFLMVVKPG